MQNSTLLERIVKLLDWSEREIHYHICLQTPIPFSMHNPYRSMGGCLSRALGSDK